MKALLLEVSELDTNQLPRAAACNSDQVIALSMYVTAQTLCMMLEVLVRQCKFQTVCLQRQVLSGKQHFG